MTSLTRLSLANRMIVGLATLAIVVFGVLATLNLKQELLPSIQVPTAIVTASYSGVSPQIVADDVSTPLETALSGVSGVTKVESTSTNGMATITVEWERSEEHTPELQSQSNLVCRLLLEKKKKKTKNKKNTNNKND